MLIFLISINILALGIFFIFYGRNNDIEDIIFGGGILTTIVGMALFITIMILLMQGSVNRDKATQLSIDYANLKYYVAHQEQYKERTLVENINKYNAELKDFRAKQSSPWLNWFYPGDLSECEYIVWKDK